MSESEHTNNLYYIKYEIGHLVCVSCRGKYRYEILQRLMVTEGGDRNQLSVGKTLFAGGMAGIFNWMVALPPDVLKSRLQTGTI